MDESKHPLFLERLDKSREAVSLAARMFIDAGCEVRVPAAQRAPTRAEHAAYSDQGDLFVNGGRVEVKWLNSHFTCAMDWPHSWGFIVCRRKVWDEAEPKPARFIYFNETLSHFGVLRPSPERQTWWIREVYDTGVGESQECYFTSVQHVSFHAKWRPHIGRYATHG